MNLRNFKPYEFDLRPHGGEDWWPMMDQRVLEFLQGTRDRHGDIIKISPHRGALGRRLGPSSTSDHNVDLHGTVRCADVFPTGVDTPAKARIFIDHAINAGFNSIGVYPHWRNGLGQQQCGFHLGYRPGLGRVARWGFVRDTLSGPQQMVAQDVALAVVGVRIPA